MKTWQKLAYPWSPSNYTNQRLSDSLALAALKYTPPLDYVRLLTNNDLRTDAMFVDYGWNNLNCRATLSKKFGQRNAQDFCIGGLY
mgnify:CR=1 FL=1